MKLLVKWVFIGLLISVLLSACGGISSPGSENESLENEEVLNKDLPEEVQDLIAEAEILPDFPLISQLDASPNVVSPGEVISINGDSNLHGSVRITQASLTETVDFSSGSGSYTVPPDAPDGIYSIHLENEGGAIAFGSFRVSTAPGIWLEVGGRYAGRDDFIKLRVTAHQIPLDMVASFRLGDLVGEESPENEYDDDFESFDPFAFEGPSAYLLPAANGELVLGGLPGVPLSEIVNQTFLLPGRFANQIQVYALDPELAQLFSDGDYEALGVFDEEFLPEGLEAFSNIVSIQQCNLGGVVSGNLGGAGTVRAVSTDGEFVTHTLSTEDGVFSIQLPAGKAFIEGWREDGEGFIYFPRQAVEVPCGEDVQMSFAVTSSPRVASLIPAARLSKVAAQSGAGEEICERILVDFPAVSVDDFEDNDQILFSSSIAAQLDGWLSRANVATMYDNRALLENAAKDQQGGGDGQGDLNDIQDNNSANIFVITIIYEFRGKLHARVKAFDRSMGSWFATADIQGDTPLEISKLPDSFIEKVQKAGICAKIEPAESIVGPNDTVELTIEMTDLNGEAHDQVEIYLTSKEPVCGSLEWTEKNIEGTSITNLYTANDELSCKDTVEFVGKTDGPQGKIYTYPDQGTAIINKPILFHFNMALLFESGADGKIDFTWDTDFYADDDGVVKTIISPEDQATATGTFTSQNVHCEVHENGVLTFRSEHLNPNATWDIELGGNMEIFENGFVEVRLIPVGTSWNFDMEPFPDECTLLLENILLWFLKSLSLQPNNFTLGGAFELGSLSDPMRANFPVEGTGGFDVTITKLPIQQRQP